MNTEVEITKIQGQMELLINKIENLAQNVEKLTAKFEANEEKYLKKEEFEKYKKENEGLLGWVEARISVEKFLLGVISLMGVTQVVTVIILIANYIRQ